MTIYNEGYLVIVTLLKYVYVLAMLAIRLVGKL